MLKIQEHQFEAMKSVVHAELHIDIERFLRSEVPSWVAHLSDEALRDAIAHEYTVGESFGMKSPRALAMFVALAFFGDSPRFYEVPEVVSALREADTDPEERLAEMFLELATELEG